ncbi:hypothetical protein MPLB_780009 [Mesorhizobium sp. ORS 3324]|nr:hypothetical protein MPLB_780009 [Mesorhizobium sp. ORS 3324]
MILKGCRFIGARISSFVSVSRHKRSQLAEAFVFVILGRSDAKRSEDPRIHAVPAAEGCSGAEFYTAGRASK